jgi:hypothetical protein
MTSAQDRDKQSVRQWPIAVSLVLCVLFLAVIALLGKREFDSSRFNAKQSVAFEARVVAEHIDGAILSVRTTLIALKSLNPDIIAGSAASSSLIEVIAVFDADGRIAAQSGAV